MSSMGPGGGAQGAHGAGNGEFPAGALSLPPADLDRRFSAFAIDRLIGWGLAAGVGYLLWVVVDSSTIVAIGAAVGTAMLVGLVMAVVLGTTGLTPGKAAVGLRVVRRSDGLPIGVGAALARTLVLGVAGLPTAGLGLATLAWTAAADPARERRAKHDHLGDAVVVDVRPLPVLDAETEDGPRQLVNLTAMRLMPVAATPENPPPPAPAPVPVPVPISPPNEAPTPAWTPPAASP
ncbi:MAG: RDD family protein, partial [Nocardioidaceae bacterium]|nr:RDD family protein [Nocardioidaceae bacterium]